MRALQAGFLLLATLRVTALPAAEDLAARADDYIRAAGLRGSILIARSGKIILAKGYGSANIELDVANRPDTKFRLASITKQFTATAILQLQERGKLNAGDRISKYIPNTPADWSEITIHHLLTHTSGIPSYTNEAGYQAHMRDRMGAPIDFIQKFRGLPLEFAPGTKFRYNNSGYFLLGVIVEQVSGLKYEDYLRKNIFGPLAMSNTGYDWPATILKNRASGYSKTVDGVEVNAEFIEMGQPYAAGSLYSTVLDLFKWDRALYTTKALTAQSIEAAFTPGTFEWGPGIKYGYGWGISMMDGHKTVGHGGGISGFSTVIYRAIDVNATVIILSNTDYADVGKMGKELLEMVLGSSLEGRLPEARP